MSISRNEHTIATSCEVLGRGYWSGQLVHVKLNPAPAGTGVLLVRTDLPGAPSCPALASFRQDTLLRTVLIRGDAKFQLVEHLMSALYGLEIDNCIVEVDGEELPGLDGSSAAFVSAIRDAGRVPQSAEKQRIVIDETTTVRLGDSWLTASPVEDDSSRFEYRLSFDGESPIDDQQFEFGCTVDSYVEQVAPARTFVTLSQAEHLKAQGVAKHVSYQDLLVFGPDGVVDNQLHFDNECARHKTLDMVGDLALTGRQLIGKFNSFRGGHNLNGQLASILLKRAELQNVSTQTQPQSPPSQRVA